MISRFYTSTRRGWTIRIACAFALFGGVLAASVNVVDEAVHQAALAMSGARVDTTTTASIGRAAGSSETKRRYRVRRSVLQPRDASCTIYSDGSSSGSC